MAYAFVSGSQAMNEGANPLTATYAATPTQGNLLIAVAKSNNTVNPGVKDANGTWTQLATVLYNTNGQSLWIFAKIADPSQPTGISTNGTGTWFLSVHEFSGNQSTLTGIIDASSTVANGASAATNSGSQPSVTTTNAGDLIICALATAGTITAPSWTGATLMESNLSTSSLIQLVDGYQIETATGTFNPSLAWTTAHTWGAITLALKPASSGGSTPPASTLSLMGVG